MASTEDLFNPDSPRRTPLESTESAAGGDSAAGADNAGGATSAPAPARKRARRATKKASAPVAPAEGEADQLATAESATAESADR